MPHHEFLGKDLARFQARCRLGRADDRNERLINEMVDQSGCQGDLGTHDSKVDSLLPGESLESMTIEGRKRHAPGIALNAAVSGNTKNGFALAGSCAASKPARALFLRTR